MRRCAAAHHGNRTFPVPVPTPMRAVPEFVMISRTSAKSTLIKPGRTISSDVPITCPDKYEVAHHSAITTSEAHGANKFALKPNEHARDALMSSLCGNASKYSGDKHMVFAHSSAA